ncbi:arylamine N-acetyltransferase family protein [Leptolyngbya sp. 7M]|uniref:arylamine N-acetyltransferase family protein n=1 Tax=Leptolyngbya sp. 7M TaxID=2812896 RepID=UPI001B8AD276|nr:arylamine N-acetyltransferase [Leptolyngbya sp. 7M]QYO65904.1 arylamine N-acetyltransferase [Leptolyngbya sp. 7M]
MNKQLYLERIGINDHDIRADAATLFHLQRRHLLSVPFENLDIYWKCQIVLDLERFFTKIVEHRRGGFCYELNGLFNELLLSIGFKTRLISARVFNGKDHGPEFDHAAIIVTIGDEEFLADVGFGDFTAEPLRFALDEEQRDANGRFTIRRFDGEYCEVAKHIDGTWRSQYIFKDTPRELSEFAEMCHYQQTSPVSHFTQGAICSIMTETGRKTLTDKKLIITNVDQKQEFTIDSEENFDTILNDEFDIRPLQYK